MGLADRDYMKRNYNRYHRYNRYRPPRKFWDRIKNKSLYKGRKKRFASWRIRHHIKKAFIFTFFLIGFFIALYGLNTILENSIGISIGIQTDEMERIGKIIGAFIGLSERLRNPTYEEMCKFVKEDKIDLNTYIYGVYVCEDFSRDVIKNAKRYGYRCGFVSIETLDGTGHGIVAFETSDNGLFFLEPQLDLIFTKQKMDEMIEMGYYSIARDYGYYYEYFDFTPISYSIQWENYA